MVTLVYYFALVNCRTALLFSVMTVSRRIRRGKPCDISSCLRGRRKGDKCRPQTPELKGESRQSRCRTTPSSPASRTKKKRHPKGCRFSFWSAGGAAEPAFNRGPRKRLDLLWGKEPQRSEGVFPPAGKRRIRSLRRRSPALHTKETVEAGQKAEIS